MVDQTDQKIVEILRKNSRTSNTEIARALSVSEGTIRKRISKLLKDGVIRGFTIVPGNQVLVALILIKVDPEFSSEILVQLRLAYNEVYEWSGPSDFSVILMTESLDSINANVDKIREMEGVINTDTLIRLS